MKKYILPAGILAGVLFIAGLFLLKTDFSIKTSPGEVVKKTFLAAVLPHHDLVAKRRADLMGQLSQGAQPKTIVLISPNHANLGGGQIITSQRSWSVANGEKTLEPNRELIDQLIGAGLAAEDNAAFDNEHGIKNLVGEIKQFFPRADFIPIALKETVTQEQAANLAEFFVLKCSDCGLIASVDMSHYLPSNLAGVHDIKTLRALTNLDDKEIWQAEVDCPGALAILIKWAKGKNLDRFNIFDHTNSGDLANNQESETTSHIFGYYNEGVKQVFPSSLTFVVAGDAMFGRQVGKKYQDNNFKDLFSNLGNRVFWGSDVSWLNLEGPISEKAVKQDVKSGSMIFNFSKQTVEALKYLKLTTVGLANNHTDNQGEKGFAATKKLLEGAGIDWLGNPKRIGAETAKRYEKDDIKISLIAINTLYEIPNISNLINSEKSDGRFVIVLPHWGNEYQLKHSQAQEKMAENWFSQGVNLIIGTHPHVVQDAQIINNKLVIYSLGNFVFDQYFSAETQRGLIVAGVVEPGKLKIVLEPIIGKDSRPEISKGGEKKLMIDRICKNIGSDCNLETGVIEMEW